MNDKKITKATLKAFIKKNKENLWVSHKSSFSGMTDGIEYLEGKFHPVKFDSSNSECTLGIQGLWVVGSSGNYFTFYEDKTFTGIEIYNCCGNSIVAIKK